jgi:hypothetical protein
VANFCEPGVDPCPGQSCDEGTDTCLGGDELEITNLSPVEYELDVLTLPNDYVACYIDRNYSFLTAPAQYVGLPYIRTANGDMRDTSDAFLTFEVNRPVTLYLLYSTSAVTPPDWVTSGFTPTGDQITRQYQTWDVWAADYAAGEIVLGGNRAAGVDTAEPPWGCMSSL